MCRFTIRNREHKSICIFVKLLNKMPPGNRNTSLTLFTIFFSLGLHSLSKWTVEHSPLNKRLFLHKRLSKRKDTPQRLHEESIGRQEMFTQWIFPCLVGFTQNPEPEGPAVRVIVSCQGFWLWIIYHCSATKHIVLKGAL